MIKGNLSDYKIKKCENEVQSKILEAYLYILLESLNGTNKMKIKLVDLMNSDDCIILRKSTEIGLTRRFHSYCSKRKLKYECVSHVIPLSNAYSTSVIVHVLSNYPRLSPYDTLNHFSHNTSVSSVESYDSNNNACLNARHYSLVYRPPDNSHSLKSKMTAISVLRDKTFSARAPSKTLERHSLNALSTVDCRLLKAAQKASYSWSCPSIITDDKVEESLPLTEWSSLLYYELSHKVGNTFFATTPIVTIDGFTHPAMKNNTRFSVGHLTNTFRSTKVEHTRNFIGKGAQLYYIEGEVFLECLSDNSIFVQSPLYSIISGWHPATVVKIPPGCNIKVFSEDDFNKLLKQYESQGYELVYSLNPLCTVRISFVKGWGAAYSRQTITSTPCWVEVHLNKPLKCLDSCLRRLNSPDNQCSSRS